MNLTLRSGSKRLAASISRGCLVDEVHVGEAQAAIALRVVHDEAEVRLDEPVDRLLVGLAIRRPSTFSSSAVRGLNLAMSRMYAFRLSGEASASGTRRRPREGPSASGFLARRHRSSRRTTNYSPATRAAGTGGRAAASSLAKAAPASFAATSFAAARASGVGGSRTSACCSLSCQPSGRRARAPGAPTPRTRSPPAASAPSCAAC